MSEHHAGEQPSQSQNPHQGEDAYEKTRPISDSLPEYTKLYQNQQQPAPRQQDYQQTVPQQYYHQPAPQQYYQQPAPQHYYQQPVYVQPVPMMTVVPKTPQQIAGEQAAQTSLALGGARLKVLRLHAPEFPPEAVLPPAGLPCRWGRLRLCSSLFRWWRL